MKTYRLSAAGRRTAIMLLVGALLVWSFAIWSLVSTLKIYLGSPQSLGVGQVVPALLMLVLTVASPLLIWNLLEEWSAAYGVSDDGLSFESLGVMITLPWSSVAGLRPADDDGDEPLDEILLRQDVGAQIANPLLRFLHRQAYGSRHLPVYAGLEGRAELLNEIRRNTAEPLRV
ncbi:MAG: hypothetical protein HGB28_03910 [Oscillochloris sp.]|nr:hypothetical protein [Oscillochloris sp.]